MVTDDSSQVSSEVSVVADVMVFAGQQIPLAGKLSESSIAMYRNSVKQYEVYCYGHGLRTDNPLALEAWRDMLVRETQLSPNSINRMVTSVKSIVNKMDKAHMVPAELAAEFQKIDGVSDNALKARKKRHARTYISPADMLRLCNAPGTKTLVGLRDTAMLKVMASTGARIAEVLDMRLDDISRREQRQSDGSVKIGYVVQVMGKTDSDPRETVLSVDAYQAIQAWVKARRIKTSSIFTGFVGRTETKDHHPTEKVICSQAAWKIVKHYAAMLELGDIKPHDFRRFVGTQLIARGKTNQAVKVLGHKNVNTLLKHYDLNEIELGVTDNLF